MTAGVLNVTYNETDSEPEAIVTCPDSTELEVSPAGSPPSAKRACSCSCPSSTPRSSSSGSTSARRGGTLVPKNRPADGDARSRPQDGNDHRWHDHRRSTSASSSAGGRLRLQPRISRREPSADQREDRQAEEQQRGLRMTHRQVHDGHDNEHHGSGNSNDRQSPGYGREPWSRAPERVPANRAARRVGSAHPGGRVDPHHSITRTMDGMSTITAPSLVAMRHPPRSGGSRRRLNLAYVMRFCGAERTMGQRSPDALAMQQADRAT